MTEACSFSTIDSNIFFGGIDISIFLKFSSKINNSPYIMAMKISFLRVLPLIIISSFSSLIVNLLYQYNLHENYLMIFTVFKKIIISLELIIPYIWIFFFTQHLSYIKHKKYNIQISFFSTISLLIYSIFLNGTNIPGNDAIISKAILIGIFNYKLYSSLKNWGDRLIFNKKLMTEIQTNFMMEVLIGTIHFTVLSCLYYYLFKLFPNINLDFSEKLNFNNSLGTPILYEIIILVPWIFGVSGSRLVKASYVQLFENTRSNIQAVLDNTNNFHYIDQSFFDLYVNIGGNGATLCLLIALFLSKRKGDKGFAKLALIPSLFNINEILIYGLPIVANVYLIIPFILVPIVFMILTYFALNLHIIPVVSNYTYWLIPSLINGFIASNRDIRVLLWQIFLIAIGTLIYAYFIKKYNSINDYKLFGEISYIHDSHTRLDVGEAQLNFLLSINDAKKNLNYLLGRGHFILYFQPIVDIKTNKVWKLESLIRLQHDELGIVSPTFLDYFKTLNQMVEVDYWVIEKSFDYGKIFEEYREDLCISINISAETFTQEIFVERLMALANKHNINPERFTLEIVEEVCLNDFEAVKKKIFKLREIGFKLAIDDFGTGYSSLSYLLDLSVDYIKIDRKFIINSNSDKGKKILKSTIDLCHSINSIVIVEGVETVDELKIVKDFGADYVQGYYYFKPNNFERTLEIIDKYR